MWCCAGPPYDHPKQAHIRLVLMWGWTQGSPDTLCPKGPAHVYTSGEGPREGGWTLLPANSAGWTLHWPPRRGGLGEWRGLSSILWMGPWGAGINTPSLEPSFCRKRWRRTPEVFPNYRWEIISLGGVLISLLRRIIKAESLLLQGRPLCTLSPRQLGCPDTVDVLGSDGNALLMESFPALNAPRLLCGFAGANVSHLWTVKTLCCVLCQGDRLVGPRWSWAF